MGQKISPTALRIGITQNWSSTWYATKKDYGKLVVEDDKIRKFVKKEYNFVGISRIDIERNRDKITVFVHAARPGLLLGRRGAKVDKLSEDLMALIKKPIDLKVIEIEKPELSATLVAESVAQQLEKRAAYRRVMRKAVETVMAAGAEGVKIRVGGRLGGAEIARAEKLSQGRIPLHTLRADIDYGTATAVITKGTIGIKVWICKGEKIPEKGQEKKHYVDAQKDKIPQVAKGHTQG